jgi:XTP/dITP diphosphohydrolase
LRIVLATGNRGKLAEFEAMLAPLRFEFAPQSAFGIEPPDETGATFAANALLKARHAASVAGLPAMADDSGLEVDALDGAPGVWSARYAGPGASDADNIAKLLRALQGVPPDARRARFRCVIAFVRSATDPAPVFGAGVWEGRILEAPRGAGGFGYDPIFEDALTGCAVAELTSADKNSRSHRRQALQALLAALAR